MIDCDQTLSTEVRILEADDPTGEFRVFQPRQRDLEYSVEHQGDRFLIRTNLFARNFRLMECPPGRDLAGQLAGGGAAPRRTCCWRTWMAFTDWLVIGERYDGLSHLRIVPMDGGPDHTLDFGEPTWSVWPETNPEMDTDLLRYGYTSLTTPRSTYTYDMRTRAKTLLKQQEVLGGFDPADYVAEYMHVTARDGVAGAGLAGLPQGADEGRHGAAAALRLRLLRLQPGRILPPDGALAAGPGLRLRHRPHPRRAGAGPAVVRGRQAAEEEEHLHRLHRLRPRPGRRAATPPRTGCSPWADPPAGLLMGAVINLDPDLWQGVVAAVPFVDVVTTMLDESIPLTTGEYDEWGNPNQKVYYDYMLSYSPYDQVEAKAYPALLVTTGLHDSQVQYWEPAKWVARLRALKTDDNVLLLRTNMDAGHGGKSGRYRSLEETALGYAFMLELAGIGK